MMINISMVFPIRSLACTTRTLSLPSRYRTPSENLVYQHGKHLVIMVRANKVGPRPQTTHSNRPRVKVLINDNYYVTQMGFMEMVGRRDTLVNHCQACDVNCIAVYHVLFEGRQPQKKGKRPIVKQTKYVKGVSCIYQLSSVQPVTNVHTAAQICLKGPD